MRFNQRLAKLFALSCMLSAALGVAESRPAPWVDESVHCATTLADLAAKSEAPPAQTSGRPRQRPSVPGYTELTSIRDTLLVEGGAAQRLGEGAEGIVYGGRLRNTDLGGLGQFMAIKLPPPAALADNGRLRTLQDLYWNAAQMSARVRQGSHPSRHKVVEAIHMKIGRVPVLKMPLVDGGPLSDWLPEGRRVSAGQVLSWGQELVAIVEAVHDAGVVHADIKPENVLLTSDGELRLVDFSLATKVEKGFDYSRGTQGYVPDEPRYWNTAYPERDVFAVLVTLERLLDPKDTTPLAKQLRDLAKARDPIPSLSTVRTALDALSTQGSAHQTLPPRP